MSVFVRGEGGRGRPEEWLSRRGGAIEAFRLPAALFGVLTSLRGSLYRWGLLPSVRVDVPVVSVGNLSAGGTGKTPLVRLMVDELRARGYRPGVLSRGYRVKGAPEQGPSDEANMLRAADPDLLHVENPDRVSGALRLVELGADAIVLDDGYQHLRLARDLDLVLVDATRPWGLPSPPEGGQAVQAVLPRGLLREKPEALARAHAIVLTRADQVSAATREALEEELHRIAPGPPLLVARHRPTCLRTVDGEARGLDTIAGLQVDVVSGIGNPEAFEATVESLGTSIRHRRRFRDHHAYADPAADLAGLGEGGVPVITTAKDAAKLRPWRTAGGPFEIVVLEVEMAIDRGEPILEALLDALPLGRVRAERAALHEGLHG